MRQIACGLLAAGLIATTATAQAQELGSASFLKQARRVAADLARSSTTAAAQAQAPAPEPRPVKITGALDFPTLYIFRGIRQETDADLTFQPWVNVAYTAAPAVTLNVGSWNSIHTGSNDGFYESDFYTSAAFSLGAITPTVMYTAYMSPDDVFKTVHEIAFLSSFNDSESTMPVAPAVTLAFETGEFGADGGAKKGIYLELAGTPTIPAPGVTITVPLKLGLSLKDYYEDPATGESDTFGYFSFGVMGLVPLTPNFDIHGGLIFYSFGDRLKEVNGGDRVEPVGTIGLGFSF